MKYKRFTSASEKVHKKFVSKEFHLESFDTGVDFKFDETCIEMKGKKRYRKTVTFVCSANQVNLWTEIHGRENLLWLFMLYDLDCKVSSIRSPLTIESKVRNREFWLMPWDFIFQFKIHNYPSWGPHYHFTTKDFPSNLDTKVINGVKYHCAADPKITELFERREFLT